MVAKAHAAKALVVFAADMLALTLLKPPGEFGADIAVGSAQRFGVPMGFGGPHAAFMATRNEYARKMPGRIVGLSKDARGEPALRLALQTREQHIRRDKATSNICTAQALLANIAGLYAAYHGPHGLKRIAQRVHAAAVSVRGFLINLGYSVTEGPIFDTLRVTSGPRTSVDVLARAAERGINLRDFDDGSVGVSCDETTDLKDTWLLFEAFAMEPTDPDDFVHALGFRPDEGPMSFGDLARTTEYLTHPVFHRYHSETEMLRYVFKLMNRDLSLTHSMIALGSCTMKLNGTSEMLPVTWPAFGRMHPFAPADQTVGYPGDVPPTGVVAGRDHRLRRRQLAAQRRQPGRVRGPAGHPRLSRVSRRRPPQRLPDPHQRPRHQPGQRRRRRLQGRRGGV